MTRVDALCYLALAAACCCAPGASGGPLEVQAREDSHHVARRQVDEARGCVCIEYYLCVNNTIDTSGGFATGPRLGEPCKDQADGRLDEPCKDPLQGRLGKLYPLHARLGEPCEDPLHVCCRLPPGSDTPSRVPQPTPVPLPTLVSEPTPAPWPTPNPRPTLAPQVEDRGCGVQYADANAVDGVYSRIHDVDDREAYYGEFPWMLALLTAEGEFVCGASLVLPQVALTAAHCLNSTIEQGLVVRAGEWDPTMLAEPELHQEVAVVRVVTHPNFYRHGLYHDVALLELASPLQEGRNVGLVCLASSPAEYDPDKCLASGWGTDELGIKTEPFKTVLRRVELPIVPREECQSNLRATRLSKYFVLHKSFLCSGGKPGKDTCRGDGGGPLVCPLKDSTVPRYVQVGIISWGVGCGERDVPAVYADVVVHKDWIADELAKMSYQLSSYSSEDLSSQLST